MAIVILYKNDKKKRGAQMELLVRENYPIYTSNIYKNKHTFWHNAQPYATKKNCNKNSCFTKDLHAVTVYNET